MARDESDLHLPQTNSSGASRRAFGGRASARKQNSTHRASIAAFISLSDNTELPSRTSFSQPEMKPANVLQNSPPRSVHFLKTRDYHPLSLRFFLNKAEKRIQEKKRMTLHLSLKTTKFLSKMPACKARHYQKARHDNRLTSSVICLQESQKKVGAESETLTTLNAKLLSILKQAPTNTFQGRRKIISTSLLSNLLKPSKSSPKG